MEEKNFTSLNAENLTRVILNNGVKLGGNEVFEKLKSKIRPYQGFAEKRYPVIVFLYHLMCPRLFLESLLHSPDPKSARAIVDWFFSEPIIFAHAMNTDLEYAMSINENLRKEYFTSFLEFYNNLLKSEVKEGTKIATTKQQDLEIEKLSLEDQEEAEKMKTTIPFLKEREDDFRFETEEDEENEEVSQKRKNLLRYGYVFFTVVAKVGDIELAKRFNSKDIDEIFAWKLNLKQLVVTAFEECKEVAERREKLEAAGFSSYFENFDFGDKKK